MKNYLNFETEIKNLEDELEKLKDPFNQSGLSEVDTQKISKTQNELDDYLDNGFYVGLTGWICDERRNKELRKSIKNIPLDKLMIETDSPYLIPRNLSPKPNKNRNEPKYLMHIANEIAKLREEPLELICESTYKNSEDFFSLT